MEEIKSFIGKAIIVILLVFLIMFIITKISSLIMEPTTCNQCGKEATPLEKHCSNCGNELIPKCNYCGNEEGHNQETKFCVECGTRIE